tara:strand:- start:2316 stop:2738 length:423 start_codon:yes stop_codon:yes gene_type:complete
MSKVIFRKVIKEDLDKVFKILNQLKELNIESIDKESAWNSFNENKSTKSIVGVLDNEIVAYGSIVIENKIRGEVAGHIEDIVVDKNYRGRFIGENLIKELINIGKKNSCYRITLFCKENLKNFYSRQGFKKSSINMKKYL